MTQLLALAKQVHALKAVLRAQAVAEADLHADLESALTELEAIAYLLYPGGAA